MEKRSLDILISISFCVSLKKENKGGTIQSCNCSVIFWLNYSLSCNVETNLCNHLLDMFDSVRISSVSYSNGMCHLLYRQV